MRSKYVVVTLSAWIGLTAVTMRAQAATPAEETVMRAIHVCAACHGPGGRSDTQSIPSIAGQSRQYLVAQLKDFRSQVRAEPGTKGYMWGISALLDDDAINGLAEFYATQTPAKGRPADPKLVQAGRRIFVDGIPARGVRACASCHGAGGEGAAAFPRLAGQRAEYVYTQLRMFGTALRPHAVEMRAETRAMSPADMRAVAAYLQSM